MPLSKNIDALHPYLVSAMEEFGINTPLRVAHFLAQIAVESNQLNAYVENLNYSAERLLEVFPKYFNKSNVKMYARNPERIGCRVYANRMGNGSESSGDGYRYRGRGLIQLTGREMYARYKAYCGFDVLAKPDLLSQPKGACRSACWFWHINNLNALADKDSVTSITKKINGGTNGLKMRQEFLNKAKSVLL